MAICRGCGSARSWRADIICMDLLGRRAADTPLLSTAGPRAAVASRRREARDQRGRRARSVATTGVVTAIDVTGIRGERGYRETPVVRFTTASGHELEVRSQRARIGLACGETVALQYDPRDSSWVRVTVGERLERLLVRAYGAGGFIGAGTGVYALLRLAS